MGNKYLPSILINRPKCPQPGLCSVLWLFTVVLALWLKAIHFGFATRFLLSRFPSGKKEENQFPNALTPIYTMTIYMYMNGHMHRHMPVVSVPWRRKVVRAMSFFFFLTKNPSPLDPPLWQLPRGVLFKGSFISQTPQDPGEVESVKTTLQKCTQLAWWHTLVTSDRRIS